MTQELVRFADLDLSDVLLNALADMKFETPSPVQAQTIPLFLEGTVPGDLLRHNPP